MVTTVPTREGVRVCRGFVRSAVGPVSFRQPKAGCAQERDSKQEEPAYSIECLHQPAVTSSLMPHYSRAVTCSEAMLRLAGEGRTSR